MTNEGTRAKNKKGGSAALQARDTQEDARTRTREHLNKREKHTQEQDKKIHKNTRKNKTIKGQRAKKQRTQERKKNITTAKKKSKQKTQQAFARVLL